MRLQVLDESARFSCGSCTFCCDQPWRTLIEENKAEALSRHDFNAYPQLAGRTFFRKISGEARGMLELAKGRGTRCLFLDTDGLCIIHKELGAEAKPQMCRQFPYLPARTWVEDRVSVSFGCLAVQQASGPPLTAQAKEIAAVVPLTPRPPRTDAPIPLDGSRTLTQDENDALLERPGSFFDERRAADVWSCFAEALALLVAVQAHDAAATPNDGEPPVLAELLRSGGDFPGTTPLPEIRGHLCPSKAPMAARVLFAATLYPNTVPAEAGAGMGLVRCLTLIPKLLSLAKLSGGYASRHVGRNVSIDDVMRHEVDEEAAPEATQLLLRYFRARFWQRMIAGTRLPIIAGVHQHIQDLNAVIFLARAEACACGADRLTGSLIRQALTRVEFPLAHQSRLYTQTLKGWLRSQLCDPGVALHSLRLMALRRAPQPTTLAGSMSFLTDQRTG